MCWWWCGAAARRMCLRIMQNSQQLLYWLCIWTLKMCVMTFGTLVVSALQPRRKRYDRNWGAQREHFIQMHTTISVCVLNQMFCIHVDSVALLQIIVCLCTTIKSIAKHKSMRSMMHLNKRRIFYWSLKSDAFCGWYVCETYPQKAAMSTFTNGAYERRKSLVINCKIKFPTRQFEHDRTK